MMVCVSYWAICVFEHNSGNDGNQPGGKGLISAFLVILEKKRETEMQKGNGWRYLQVLVFAMALNEQKKKQQKKPPKTQTFCFLLELDLTDRLPFSHRKSWKLFLWVCAQYHHLFSSKNLLFHVPYDNLLCSHILQHLPHLFSCS